MALDANMVGDRAIAIFLQDLSGGGAERAAVNLINEFASRGIPTDVLLVRPDGPYGDLVDPRAKRIVLGTRKTSLSVPAIVRYLTVQRPAALLSFQTHVNVVAIVAHALAGAGCPIVVSEQVDPGTAVKHASKNVRLAYALAPRLYRHASHVAAVSDGVADEWRALTSLPDGRVVRIHNPIFHPSILIAAREESGEPWLDKPTEPVVVAAGRLEEQKGFPTLLRAFLGLRREKPSRLVILGEGPERPRLEAMIADLGLRDSVRLVGFQKNPFAFFARAHVFALSSRFEGLPTVLVEALACGANVVSTDCPHGPREILEGGRWGALVPVDDEGAMARALVGAISVPRSGTANLRRAEAFSVRSVANEFARLLLPVGSTHG